MANTNSTNWDDFTPTGPRASKPVTKQGAVNWDDFSPVDQGGTASDLAKSVKVGVQRLPGMVTGLADLPIAAVTGARPFTKAADALGEATGFQPGKWADETKFSKGYEEGRANVDKAWKEGDAGEIALSYLRNPGYTANQVAESLPGMVVGGAAGRVLMGAGAVAGAAADAAAGTAARAAIPGVLARTVGEKLAAPVAAGIGEGAVTAGQQMAQYTGDDQQKNAFASLGAGVGTGVLGMAAGRVANKLGLETAETAMAKIGTSAVAEATQPVGRRVLGGMVSEAVLQELPQSVQEQMWQNYADGKDIWEGVARQAVEGAIAGGVMGAGANVSGASNRRAVEQDQAARQRATDAYESATQLANEVSIDNLAGPAVSTVPTAEPATFEDLVNQQQPAPETDQYSEWDRQTQVAAQPEAATSAAQQPTEQGGPTLDQYTDWEEDNQAQAAMLQRPESSASPAPNYLADVQNAIRSGTQFTTQQTVETVRTAMEDAWLRDNVEADSNGIQSAEAVGAQLQNNFGQLGEESATAAVDARVRTGRILSGLQNVMDGGAHNTMQVLARLNDSLVRINEAPLQRDEVARVRRMADAYMGFKGAREPSPLPRVPVAPVDKHADNSSMEALIPARPMSEQMGIDRKAGPLSRAAADAVDSGLHASMTARSAVPENTHAQAASAPVASAAQSIPATGAAAQSVEAARTAPQSQTTGVNLEPQTDQAQQAGAQPTQAGAAQAGVAAEPIGQGLSHAATPQNDGAQGTPQAATPGQTSTPAQSVTTARPPNWRTSMLRAGAVARGLGIDTKGKHLPQVLAEIDAADARLQQAAFKTGADAGAVPGERAGADAGAGASMPQVQSAEMALAEQPLDEQRDAAPNRAGQPPAGAAASVGAGQRERDASGEPRAAAREGVADATDPDERASPVAPAAPAKAQSVTQGPDLKSNPSSGNTAGTKADDLFEDIPFRRSTSTFSPEARMQAVRSVEETVNAIRSAWGGNADVIVAFDMQDPVVPESARRADLKQRSGGARGAPEGFYYRGKTYLMASSLSTPQDAARVLFHEVLGHHGLRGRFGKELNNILNEIAMRRPKEVNAKIKEYGLRGVSNLDRRAAAEEVLAEMAQTVPQIDFVQRAIAAIRTWLRNNVPGFGNLKLTDNEIIRSYILPAREWVTRGGRSASSDGLQFSRSQDASVDIRQSGKRPSDPLLFDGSADLWLMPEEVESRTRGVFTSAPVRLLNGVHRGPNRGYGLIHIEASHASEIAALGITTAEYVYRIISGATKVYDPGNGRLLVVNERFAGRHQAILELRDDGDHYSVVSAFSRKPEGKVVWSGRSSSASLPGAQGTPSVTGKTGSVNPTPAVESSADSSAVRDDGKPQIEAPKPSPSSRIADQTGESLSDDSDLGDEPMFSRAQPAVQYDNPAQAASAERAFGTITKESVVQRVKNSRHNLATRLRQGLVDQFAPIKEVSEKGYILARLSKGTNGAVEAALMYGKPFLRDGVADVDVKDGGFAKVLASLKGEHDRFFQWVAAHRAERLKAEGKENLLTDTDISTLKTLNAGHFADGKPRVPAYAAALRELNAFNEASLKIALESGLIDQAAFDLMKDQPYVPFYRLMEDGDMRGPRFSSGLINQQAFKKLKGGTQQINSDLLANTLMNWSSLYAAAARNRAALETMKSAADMGIAYQVPADTKGAIKVMRDGVAEHWAVEDPYLLDAISAMAYTPNSVIKAMAPFKRLLTFGITVNPTFKIRNLIRDSLSAMAQSDLSYNPLDNVAKGWKATSKDSQTYASMLASGGIIRFGSQENTQGVREHIAKLGGTVLDDSNWGKLKGQMKSLWGVYEEFGDRTENLNRAALYERLVAKGHSHAEASFMARDLMDFSMSGKWEVVRFLTQTVPFLNARLQGLYKLGRAANEDPRRFAVMAGAVSLASLGLMAAYADDDDWKKREDWDRDNYWWFKIGGHAYRIPKPFEVGSIGTLAERTAELMFSKEMTGKRFGARISDMVFNTFAMDPTPQALKPFLDVYANKDSFSGKAIEGMADERLRPEDRYNERTSEVARLLGSFGLPDPVRLAKGEYSGLSPKQVDFLLRGYFGWLATVTTTATDTAIRPMLDRGDRPALRLRDTFLAGNFVEALPTGSSRYVTAMYEQSRDIEQSWASYQEALKSGDTVRAQKIQQEEGPKLQSRLAVNHAKTQMSELSRQAKRVESSQLLSAEQKREKLDAISVRKDEIAKRVASMTTH